MLILSKIIVDLIPSIISEFTTQLSPKIFDYRIELLQYKHLFAAI
jgi:hypothetical protein